MKGLMVNVYRTAGYSCVLNKITENADRVLLVGDGVPEVSEAGDLPVLKLVKRNLYGTEYLHTESIETAHAHRMFGGNFIHTSDSRFPNKYPIPVHDREER